MCKIVKKNFFVHIWMISRFCLYALRKFHTENICIFFFRKNFSNELSLHKKFLLLQIPQLLNPLYSLYYYLMHLCDSIIMVLTYIYLSTTLIFPLILFSRLFLWKLSEFKSWNLSEQI